MVAVAVLADCMPAVVAERPLVALEPGLAEPFNCVTDTLIEFDAPLGDKPETGIVTVSYCPVDKAVEKVC